LEGKEWGERQPLSKKKKRTGPSSRSGGKSGEGTSVRKGKSRKDEKILLHQKGVQGEKYFTDTNQREGKKRGKINLPKLRNHQKAQKKITANTWKKKRELINQPKTWAR